MIMKLLLKISYIGTNYQGFQCQKSGLAVQNIMTDAAEKVFGFPCNITGCSRTDAGVHALGFCLTVEPREDRGEDWCTVPTGKVHRAFAPHLPQDIAVLGAAKMEGDFHARYSARGKEYIYKIWDGAADDPFVAGRSCRRRIPVTAEGEQRMCQAAKAFVGEHDFAAFMASGSKITDCVRTVYDARVERNADGMLKFTVSANGFLYNMVRIMAGTLLECAVGKIEPDDIENIIKARKRENAGFTAPPEGLYLNRVFYDEDIIFECD